MTDRPELDPTAMLRRYYEVEAEDRLRLAPRGRRVQVRAAFMQLLGDEGRRRVLDIGAGPGSDGTAFAAAGLASVGVDLAVGNAHLAAERGVVVVPGSALAVPVVDGWADAGWSMSTLMHLTDDEAAAALDEVRRVCAPGAPVLVGQWGGAGGEIWTDAQDRLPARRSVHRSAATNWALLERLGSIEWRECWSDVADGWEYHIARVRIS